MKERKYYVENAQTREIYELSIKDIEFLSEFATTLESKDEISNALGYANALGEFYKDSTNRYRDTYYRLVSSNYGTLFLCTNINLSLMEKIMREKGISEGVLKSYEEELKEYHRLIEFNRNTFEGEKHNIR